MGYIKPKECNGCQSEYTRAEGCLTQRSGYCKDFSAWRPEYYVLQEQNAKMLEIIKFYADKNNWEYCNEDYPCEDLRIRSRIADEDTDNSDSTGGEMARKFLEELEEV